MLLIPYYFVAHVLSPREMQRSKINQENIYIDKTVKTGTRDGKRSKVPRDLSTACFPSPSRLSVGQSKVPRDLSTATADGRKFSEELSTAALRPRNPRVGKCIFGHYPFRTVEGSQTTFDRHDRRSKVPP